MLGIGYEDMNTEKTKPWSLDLHCHTQYKFPTNCKFTW